LRRPPQADSGALYGPESGVRICPPGAPARVLVRCYAELNDYLPRTFRQHDIGIEPVAKAKVHSTVGALGIPPAAIELILVNGTSSTLEHELQDGDRVSLYPVFESFDVTSELRLRRHALRRLRFVADAHLGRLARYSRLLGFDTLFENDPGDRELARISAQEGRILLSRDRGLLMRRSVTRGLWIPPLGPREQVRYLVERLDLYGEFRPFTRCTRCNSVLDEVDPHSRDIAVPPLVKVRCDRFWRCPGCGRTYWRGSHYDRLAAFVAELASGGHRPPGRDDK